MKEEIKHPRSERINMIFKLREENRETSFNIILNMRNFLRDIFSFSCNYFKFRYFIGGRRGRLVNKEELRDSLSILLIRFRRSKFNLRKSINDRGIDDNRRDISFGKEREEVNVVDRGRLHTNKERGEVIRERIECIKERGEALRRLRERLLGNNLSLSVSDADREGILRDINTNKEGEIHDSTSYRLILKAGTASSFFLHNYTGLRAQPTYSNSRKQRTHSLSGLESPGITSSSCFLFSILSFPFILFYKNYW
jgi:hypothetical protein